MLEQTQEGMRLVSEQADQRRRALSLQAVQRVHRPATRPELAPGHAVYIRVPRADGSVMMCPARRGAPVFA